MSERRSRTLPYLKVAADLRAAITAGEYGSGAKLPAEDELGRRYGVSRGTVRQALASLHADGLVTSRRGTRRVVLGAPRLHGFGELRSFTDQPASGNRPTTPAASHSSLSSSVRPSPAAVRAPGRWAPSQASG
ncbi:GntR family transcriptional regulator [Streptomyces sp. NPDC096136]|uniref:GntR family transcriptional regulator n=1 Tax=Streptomyces sp. NPDC096136 TaxID=3366076 RepID=UPI0038282328